MSSITVYKRLKNIGIWLLFIADTFVNTIFFFVPVLPITTGCLLSRKMQKSLKTYSLSTREIFYIKHHHITTGWACITVFLGLLFGCLGTYTPRYIFEYHSHPFKVILQRRKNNKCCICLSQYKLDILEDVYQGKCGHVFHTVCIDQWINTNRHCPLCRCFLS